MLGLNDIKQTRFYQETYLEGHQEGRLEERRKIIEQLDNSGNTPDAIAEMLDLSIEEVTKILQFSDEN